MRQFSCPCTILSQLSYHYNTVGFASFMLVNWEEMGGIGKDSFFNSKFYIVHVHVHGPGPRPYLCISRLPVMVASNQSLRAPLVAFQSSSDE